MSIKNTVNFVSLGLVFASALGLEERGVQRVVNMVCLRLINAKALGKFQGRLQQIMEEVLRKMYQDHHKSLQRRRLEKVLDGDHYALSSRKKYDFRQDSTLRTPETTFSLDQDIRFEKEFHKTGKQLLSGCSNIQARFNRLKLPLVTNKESRSRLRRRFKAAVLALVFLQRVKRGVRLQMLRRKRKSQKHALSLVGNIERLVRGYYQKLLREELLEYLSLLERRLETPDADQQKEVVQVLYYMAQKLAGSTISRQLMTFFGSVATEHGFPPSDFLSGAEINHLDFSSQFGCTINVSQQQTRMIIGLGLGIKIFCFYVLYRPWNLSFCSETLKQRCSEVKEMINNVGSVFYFLLLEQFCLNIKEVRSIKKSLIANLGVRAIKQLDPHGEGNGGSTSKALVAEQSRFFLNNMEFRYPNLLKGIKQNLMKWISRISYACLKEDQKRANDKDEGSTVLSTVDQSRKSEAYETRRVFRSVQLNKKKQQLMNLNKVKSKSRYDYSLGKRTIQ